jgi:3D (Asp-Asp-Asp) domain-containing protein
LQLIKIVVYLQAQKLKTMFEIDPKTLKSVDRSIQCKKQSILLFMLKVWCIISLFIIFGHDCTKTIEKRLPTTIACKSKINYYEEKSDTLKHSVSASFYNATAGQCGSSPNVTASGFKIDNFNPYKHKIIAVSRDLEKLGFTLGSKVLIYFKDKYKLYSGEYTVQDRMHSRWINKIDLLVNIDMPMGLSKGVKIVKIIN